MVDYYTNIFKRKSFHLFRNVGSDLISDEQLRQIEEVYKSFTPLDKDIKTALRIVKASDVNFKRDAQYCLLIYSEKKDNYLTNVGYLGEQLDLYLVSQNIGTLWFGIGKPDIDTYMGLDYVIMIAIHKVNDLSMYRKDMYKSKRKPLEEIWKGEHLGIGDIVRFAPSACNSQPWYVENNNDELIVYRYKKPGKRGIMPVKMVSYYNRIDMGIFLLFMDICLKHNNIKYEVKYYVDEGKDIELTMLAEYKIIKE